MEFMQRLGNYMFIIGALIAIFSGAFPVSPEMEIITRLLLVLTGAFVGLLNINEDREFHFVLATAAFIIASQALSQHITDLALISSFEPILASFIIFSASAAAVVALKLIFSFGTVHEGAEEKLTFVDPHSEKIWNLTVFIAVCFAFVLFVLEAFFYTNGLQGLFIFLSYIVILVFIVDVIVLFNRSKSVRNFFKFHWPDIIAIIPFAGVFQLAKLFRFVRIARMFSKGSKLARVSKISHSTKFFSQQSGFNKYIKKK